MRIKYRELGKNEKCEQPSEIMVVDTETEPKEIRGLRGTRYDEHRLRLGHAIYWRWDGREQSRRRELSFNDPAVFWAWVYGLVRRKSPLWMFAHNWAFDAAILDYWREIESGRIRFKRPGVCYSDPETGELKRSRDFDGFLVLGPTPWIAYCVCDRGRLNLIDTVNYWKCSLESLGESYGVRKLPMPDFDEPDQVWAEYCRRDCEVLEAAVTGLMREWRANDLGNWQPTAGRLAMSCYKHRFREGKILKHDCPDATEMERACYYGGEARVWFKGEWASTTYYVDARSLYPAMMERHQFPVKLVAIHDAPTPDLTRELIADRIGFASVRVHSFSRTMPLRSDRGLMFPTGEFETCLCGPELKSALESGEVVAVRRLFLYLAGRPFERWCRYWFDVRARAEAEHRQAGADLAKLLMNSLPGKFGQRSKTWKFDPAVRSPVAWGRFLIIDSETRSCQEARSIGWQAQLPGESGEPRDSFPAIAACVTAYGRWWMRLVRSCLPDRSRLYQHTDGLIVTPEGLEALGRAGWMERNKPGFLSIRDTFKHLVIRGIANYTADGVDHIAGIKPTAWQHSYATWQQQHFENSKDHIGRGPDGTVRVTRQTLYLPGDDHGETFGPDGWSTAI